MSGRELPKGWESAHLSVLATKIGSGATPKGGEKVYKATGTPLIRSLNVYSDGFRPEGLAFLDDQQADALKGVEVRSNDVLLNITGASIGRVTVAPNEMSGARVNQHVCIIRTVKGVESAFVRAFLASPQMQSFITDENYGVTRQALTKEMIENFDVPLPPLPEQRRIVEKIEALTARSRRAREALDSLPSLIDRYRQSILAAAFRGDLTAEWRENKPPESASAWLQEILAKRESLWLRFGRGSHRPPFAPERSLEVPDDWIVTTLDALLAGIQGGKNFRCEERPPQQNEVGVVKISAVTWGEFDEEESKTVLDRSVLAPSTLIEPGDFLFSRANTLELVGSCVIVSEMRKELYLSDKVLRFHFADDFIKQWVLWFLRSPAGRKQIEETSSGNQLSMRNIGQDSIRQIAIPLPPAAEMSFILSAIERRVSTFRALESATTEQTSRLATLDQSILAKAFRGELVPQDPNDEPASVLLERIRAERAAAGTSPRRGRRART